MKYIKKILGLDETKFNIGQIIGIFFLLIMGALIIFKVSFVLQKNMQISKEIDNFVLIIAALEFAILLLTSGMLSFFYEKDPVTSRIFQLAFVFFAVAVLAMMLNIVKFILNNNIILLSSIISCFIIGMLLLLLSKDKKNE